MTKLKIIGGYHDGHVVETPRGCDSVSLRIPSPCVGERVDFSLSEIHPAKMINFEITTYDVARNNGEPMFLYPQGSSISNAINLLVKEYGRR